MTWSAEVGVSRVAFALHVGGFWGAWAVLCSFFLVAGAFGTGGGETFLPDVECEK